MAILFLRWRSALIEAIKEDTIADKSGCYGWYLLVACVASLCIFALLLLSLILTCSDPLFISISHHSLFIFVLAILFIVNSYFCAIYIKSWFGVNINWVSLVIFIPTIYMLVFRFSIFEHNPSLALTACLIAMFSLVALVFSFFVKNCKLFQHPKPTIDVVKIEKKPSS